MRRGLILLLLIGSAAGQDSSAAADPFEAMALKVLAAFEAGEEEAIAALAEQDLVDPWVVADVLLAEGRRDAALAYARAAPRRDMELLASYLEVEGVEDTVALRKVLQKVLGRSRAGDSQGIIDALEDVDAKGDRVVPVTLTMLRAQALTSVGRHEESAEAYLNAGARAERIGWLRRAASAYLGAGRAYWKLEDWDGALEAHKRLLEVREARGDRSATARALEAIGQIQLFRTDYGHALSFRERALTAYRELEDRAGEARQLLEMGWVQVYLNAYAKALSCYAESLSVAEETGDRPAMAQALARIGNTHTRLGDLPTALSCYERELSLLEESKTRHRMPNTWIRLGGIYQQLGDLDRARSCYEQAFGIAEELEATYLMANATGAMAGLCRESGEHARALELLQRAGELYVQSGNRYWMALNLCTVAEIHRDLGEHDEALAVARRALELMRALDARFGECVALRVLGDLHAERGDAETAMGFYDRTIRLARRIRNRELVVFAYVGKARIHLESEEPGRALSCARQGLAELEHLLGGLAEGEGSAGRGKFMDLFGLGVLAAARLEDPDAAVEFLENGRAGTLLETLGGGRAARHANLPEELVVAETAAKTAESRARSRHERALDGGDREEIEVAAKDLDAAVAQRRAVVARIQREAKRAAGVFYPRAALLEEIQDELPQDSALLLYGLCEEEALALVVTRDDARFVTLGTVKDLEEACSAAIPMLEQPGSRGMTREGEDAAPPTEDDGLQQLRSLLVEPLKLGEEVKAVLVSPAGALGYVPWGALLVRPVACVPSGTTWVTLLEDDRRPGKKILALGDPSYGAQPGDRALKTYRGGGLHRLPATGPEAKAVGDTVLLGEEATETGLATALGKERRWRAVHLACHGLVDTERPLLSSLALTPGDEEDGFLTCLDIFGLEVPADLVVLSACETARGKVAKAEGIVGLTRAFMYAGSPRILCSLWKVDDEATRALMVKFYELWNPDEGEGLPAAAALRQAQEFVRSQEKWSHPHYWAAWVLWGLAE